MGKIKYICYYGLPDQHPSRNYVLSAVNKVTYICRAINDCGHDVEIISASGSSKREPGEECRVLDGTILKLFPSLGTGSKIKRVFSRWYFMLQFFLYLFFNTQKGEKVIAYHSPGYVRMLRILKWIKKFRLILEVEEIYADVSGNKKLRKAEMKLFRVADAYIFPTELLDEKLNAEGKPSVIIHGTYNCMRREYDRFCF